MFSRALNIHCISSLPFRQLVFNPSPAIGISFCTERSILKPSFSLPTRHCLILPYFLKKRRFLFRAFPISPFYNEFMHQSMFCAGASHPAPPAPPGFGCRLRAAKDVGKESETPAPPDFGCRLREMLPQVIDAVPPAPPGSGCRLRFRLEDQNGRTTLHDIRCCQTGKRGSTCTSLLGRRIGTGHSAQ